jgi:hypothetical protein
MGPWLLGMACFSWGLGRLSAVLGLAVWLKGLDGIEYGTISMRIGISLRTRGYIQIETCMFTRDENKCI